MEKFWQFRNQTAESAELLLYGDISETSWWGDEVTPKQFAEDLNALGAVKEISVRINSGGGDVFVAQAIGNLLEQHAAKVTARIDGVCASAATIVACHCEKVVAANDSTYMIHPVKMGICGYADAETLQQYIDALNTLRENIVTLYAKKTGREKDEVAAWMDATSWWTAPQAKENGFVDELTDDGKETVENRGGFLFVNGVGMGVEWKNAPEFVRSRETRSANTKPAGKPGELKEAQATMDPKNSIKTVDDLRAAYPALVDEIERAAAEKATNTERKRIQDIEEATLSGSEALATEAKFTKPVNAEDFYKMVLKNAKEQGATYLAQTRQDAERSGVNNVKNTPPAKQNEGDEFMAALKGLGKKN